MYALIHVCMSRVHVVCRHMYVVRKIDRYIHSHQTTPSLRLSILGAPYCNYGTIGPKPLFLKCISISTLFEMNLGQGCCLFSDRCRTFDKSTSREVKTPIP